MTSVFDGMRADPHSPRPMVPLAATGADTDDGEAGVGASFFLQLGATLGSIDDKLGADQQRRDRQHPPGNEQLFAAGVAPASGVLTLDLGSVPQGRVWQVRRLVVGGVSVTTSAAGSAYAFSTGAPPDLSLTDCVDIFLTLPQGDTFGTHQLFLIPPEHLWVVFSGATPNQQYSASARVEDWEERAFMDTYTEQ